MVSKDKKKLLDDGEDGDAASVQSDDSVEYDQSISDMVLDLKNKIALVKREDSLIHSSPQEKFGEFANLLIQIRDILEDFPCNIFESPVFDLKIRQNNYCDLDMDMRLHKEDILLPPRRGTVNLHQVEHYIGTLLRRCTESTPPSNYRHHQPMYRTIAGYFAFAKALGNAAIVAVEVHLGLDPGNAPVRRTAILDAYLLQIIQYSLQILGNLASQQLEYSVVDFDELCIHCFVPDETADYGAGLLGEFLALVAQSERFRDHEPLLLAYMDTIKALCEHHQKISQRALNPLGIMDAICECVKDVITGMLEDYDEIVRDRRRMVAEARQKRTPIPFSLDEGILDTESAAQIHKCLRTLTETMQGPCLQNQIQVIRHGLHTLVYKVIQTLNDKDLSQLRIMDGTAQSLEEAALTFLTSLLEKYERGRPEVDDVILAFILEFDKKKLLLRIEGYYRILSQIINRGVNAVSLSGNNRDHSEAGNNKNNRNGNNPPRKEEGWQFDGNDNNVNQLIDRETATGEDKNPLLKHNPTTTTTKKAKGNSKSDENAEKQENETVDDPTPEQRLEMITRVVAAYYQLADSMDFFHPTGDPCVSGVESWSLFWLRHTSVNERWASLKMRAVMKVARIEIDRNGSLEIVYFPVPRLLSDFFKFDPEFNRKILFDRLQLGAQMRHHSVIHSVGLSILATAVWMDIRNRALLKLPFNIGALLAKLFSTRVNFRLSWMAFVFALTSCILAALCLRLGEMGVGSTYFWNNDGAHTAFDAITTVMLVLSIGQLCIDTMVELPFVFVAQVPHQGASQSIISLRTQQASDGSRETYWLHRWRENVEDVFTFRNPKMFLRATLLTPIRSIRLLYRWLCVVCCILSLALHPVFVSFCLLEVVIVSGLDTTLMKIQGKIRTILKLFALATVVAFCFSALAFAVFNDSMMAAPGSWEGAYFGQSLLQIFLYFASMGFRSDGGIGDFLRPLWYELGAGEEGSWTFYGRWVFDLSFFLLINMYIINLILALLVDGLGKARDEEQAFYDTLDNECLVCGLSRPTINRFGPGFAEHLNKEHDMWEYVAFLFHLAFKESLEFTGAEQYVMEQVEDQVISFFPTNRCLSVRESDPKLQLQDLAEEILDLIDRTHEVLSAASNRVFIANKDANPSSDVNDHNLKFPGEFSVRQDYLPINGQVNLALGQAHEENIRIQELEEEISFERGQMNAKEELRQRRKGINKKNRWRNLHDPDSLSSSFSSSSSSSEVDEGSDNNGNWTSSSTSSGDSSEEWSSRRGDEKRKDHAKQDNRRTLSKDRKDRKRKDKPKSKNKESKSSNKAGMPPKRRSHTTMKSYRVPIDDMNYVHNKIANNPRLNRSKELQHHDSSPGHHKHNNQQQENLIQPAVQDLNNSENLLAQTLPELVTSINTPPPLINLSPRQDMLNLSSSNININSANNNNSSATANGVPSKRRQSVTFKGLS